MLSSNVICQRSHQSVTPKRWQEGKSQGDAGFHHELTEKVNPSESELTAHPRARQEGGVPQQNCGMQKSLMSGKRKLAARGKMKWC